MTDHTPMQLEKYYTYYIERRLHILYNPASAKLTIGLLMFNVLIQFKIIQYWWWFWGQWCRDVASGIDRHPDKTEIDFRLQIQGNRKLIPCSSTFREVFSHPYISFFHLLVKIFSVIGERAKQARHSQVCTIENRGNIIYYGTCNFSL